MNPNASLAFGLGRRWYLRTRLVGSSADGAREVEMDSTIGIWNTPRRSRVVNFNSRPKGSFGISMQVPFVWNLVALRRHDLQVELLDN